MLDQQVAVLPEGGCQGLDQVGELKYEFRHFIGIYRQKGTVQEYRDCLSC